MENIDHFGRWPEDRAIGPKEAHMPQGFHAFTFSLFGLTRRRSREDEQGNLHPLDHSGRFRQDKSDLELEREEICEMNFVMLGLCPVL
jgi:hypothetical protein